MLRPLLRELKAQGVPFANPYRRADREWNPLRLGNDGAFGTRAEITRLDRALAFLRGDAKLFGPGAREWTYEEIKQWTHPLRASGKDAVLTHGAKAMLTRLAKLDKSVGACPFKGFGELFVGGWDGPHAAKAWAFDIDWWVESMLPKETSSYTYLANIVRHCGPRALIDPPNIIPGTIHSVKGGEADTVILIPDLSIAAVKPYWAGDTAPIGRLFYVAMTRARETLLICNPAGPYHAGLQGGLPLYHAKMTADTTLTQAAAAL
jgi:hypothetical protein